MNILIYDDWEGKFSKQIGTHWTSLGHAVKYNLPSAAITEADIVFFYQASNTLVKLSKENAPHKASAFAQCVDIDVWAGQANGVNWPWLDGVLFMAPHIKDMVNYGTTPSAIIKPGIDTEHFSQRPPFNPDAQVRKIAYVVGDKRIWDVKRLDVAFMILHDLLATGKFIWQLHIRGSYSSHAQYNAYCKYLEKDLGLEGFVFWYPEKVEDMNGWLEDKDYFILPSTKEAFSYATAEAMSKGIKPIIGNWEGSKETWGKHVCSTYGEMLAELLHGEYKADEYRQYVLDNYTQERYFKELDEFIFGEEVKYGIL